ncbi:inter-alpha-trypsin inhibitor heavy chain H4-like isoform X2 [Anabas testudineus]|uniref:inter-alpha-trypsin inhibitor heavy chain H4-like isoform X2 n=1 Tax=Anabas testudineus TaxID=64144 RepID=UPI000E453D91|nr:inter-alpha-trypsin inhibitor heavy chain H4-like isoform X2 [Anabas testudineus]
MERAVVQITLFGLLLCLVTTLPNKDDWDIYSFHINSTVSSRYATTVITSRVANRMNESKEIEFQVRIPKNAFISKFTMFIDGQVYDGVVKAKEEAEQQYTEAVSRGQSAGLVSSVGRTLEEFKTSVTVAAHKKVTFELTYEELLKRRLGKYELQIHARPMQPVKDFKVDVYIHEKAGINFIETKGGLSTKALANAITKTQTETEAWVYFYPTEAQQRACDSCGEQGMNGDLVVVYDVNRDVASGDIKTSYGYFVHHFAPSSLPRIPKNVVFVIDRSGSMKGRKIEQTRIALIHILNDLAEDDYFGLITFDGNIFHWKRELVQASKTNVNSAKKFARGIRDGGYTDINEAVLEGAHMLNAHPREGSASILILLTDGDPTTGETNLERIHSNVRRAIADKFPLYCLGFGFDVSFEFLEKMSLQNNGVARRIYEDSDADLQLKGFYEEVATPLLTNVTMMYTGGTNLTQTHFSQYYNGSEIVVAGQITDNDIETFTPEVVAVSGTQRLRFFNKNATVESTGTVTDRRIQRVWAYLTVKQLLEKELQLSGPEKARMKKEALELSLKYSFVTPFTSMVVTKPPGENTDVLHKPKEGEKHHYKPIIPLSPAHMPQRPAIIPLSPAHMPQRPAIIPLSPAHMPQRPAIIPLSPAHMPQRPAIIPLSPAHMPQRPGQSHRRKEISRIHTGHSPVLARPRAPYPGVQAPYSDTAGFPGGSHGDFYLLHRIHQVLAVSVFHRILLKAENQSLPLCFDVPGNTYIKLFHHPSDELSVNGLLDSVANRGFKIIGIHFKNNQYIEIVTNGINVQAGQGVTRNPGQDLVTADITVFGRDKEFDVAVGDTRMVILVHEKDGNKFLWPVLRQRPSDDRVDGILALKAAVYEEVQQSPSTKLKIRDQEIDVTRSSAVDYSISIPPTLDCWFMSAESALQRRLDDFTAAQL